MTHQGLRVRLHSELKIEERVSKVDRVKDLTMSQLTTSLEANVKVSGKWDVTIEDESCPWGICSLSGSMR